nr:hypothetical protein [Tanacetum cinerariifolium]
MHPPSPDYVPGPEHPPSLDYVLDLERPPSHAYVPYVLEHVYPEFMPPEDNDDDEKEEEPSEDDADDDKEEEEEEHPAPVDSIPPPLLHRTTARISVPAQAPIPFLSEVEVERLFALRTPPPSLLTPYSSPLPHIPPLLTPYSSPLPHIPSPQLSASPTHPLGYRDAMIQLRAESPSTSHPLPLPPPIVLPHTRESMAMMRAAIPSTYILAPRSETPPSGYHHFYLYHYLHHHHLCFYPLLTVEDTTIRLPPLLPIPLPTSSPPLFLPSTDRRVDVPE